MRSSHPRRKIKLRASQSKKSGSRRRCTREVVRSRSPKRPAPRRTSRSKRRGSRRRYRGNDTGFEDETKCASYTCSMENGRGTCTLNQKSSGSGGESALKYNVTVHPIVEATVDTRLSKATLDTLSSTLETAYNILANPDGYKPLRPISANDASPEAVAIFMQDIQGLLSKTVDIDGLIQNIKDLEEVTANSPLLRRLVKPFLDGDFSVPDETDDEKEERVSRNLLWAFDNKQFGGVINV